MLISFFEACFCEKQARVYFPSIFDTKNNKLKKRMQNLSCKKRLLAGVKILFPVILEIFFQAIFPGFKKINFLGLQAPHVINYRL